ncbi:MAG: NAD-dependent epimerase/dehydratase family protein, partial [Nanoarchaeota archaeon]
MTNDIPQPNYAIQRMDGKKILVIGGLGFIGSNIAQRCVSLGASVTIYDACLDPYGWNFANIKEIQHCVRFIKGDTRDAVALKDVIVGQDIIYDCAAQVSHLISVKDPHLDIDITLRGGMNVLETVRHHNTNAVLIYAGTRGAV